MALPFLHGTSSIAFTQTATCPGPTPGLFYWSKPSASTLVRGQFCDKITLLSSILKAPLFSGERKRKWGEYRLDGWPFPCPQYPICSRA